MRRLITGHNRTKREERGSILVMTAIFMLVLLLAVGAAIDASRIYMMRAELQNAADAAALAATRELNAGAGGLQDAVNAATATAMQFNTYSLNKVAVTVNPNTGVEFAVNLDSPDPSGRRYVNWQTISGWDTATRDDFAEQVRFVRVTTQAGSLGIIFSQAVLGASHTESRSAIAGVSRGLNVICDFFPMAVALADPSPTPGTVMTLTFTQGTGSEATVLDKDYITLEVPEISGNGLPETAKLAAGQTTICQRLNGFTTLKMTPSSNVNNGPVAISEGVNTRFDMYANGYGNALQPTAYPPDANIQNPTALPSGGGRTPADITFEEYANRTSGTTAAPPSSPPGLDERRILVTPIIEPKTYTTPQAPTLNWGAWFLKQPSQVDSPCSKSFGCATIRVEWIGKFKVGGRGAVDSCVSGNAGLGVVVLYR